MTKYYTATEVYDSSAAKRTCDAQITSVPKPGEFNRTVLPIRMVDDSGISYKITLLGKEHISQFLEDSRVELRDLEDLVGRDVKILLSATTINERAYARGITLR